MDPSATCGWNFKMGFPDTFLRSGRFWRSTCGGGDGGEGAAPKVVLREQHLGLVARHALHIVAPAPAHDIT